MIPPHKSCGVICELLIASAPIVGLGPRIKMDDQRRLKTTYWCCLRDLCKDGEANEGTILLLKKHHTCSSHLGCLCGDLSGEKCEAHNNAQQCGHKPARGGHCSGGGSIVLVWVMWVLICCGYFWWAWWVEQKKKSMSPKKWALGLLLLNLTFINVNTCWPMGYDIEKLLSTRGGSWMGLIWLLWGEYHDKIPLGSVLWVVGVWTICSSDPDTNSLKNAKTSCKIMQHS